MTQEIIEQKFIKFLLLTKQENTGLRKALTTGKCLGFDICDGAMDLTGFSEWWNTLLSHIAYWDETEETLSKEIILPNSRLQSKKKH